ncbi:Peripheral myelin protein 22 [Collichthys lucidus]|uniref:Peripheral myelin protein 22 n=1 Tax=Collichthys lucidus TaxID=240159 RepID=A0A4U5VTJ7_COLLU|nr:Peripheral myelin protein 22 [Collichthys lucidus]
MEIFSSVMAHFGASKFKMNEFSGGQQGCLPTFNHLERDLLEKMLLILLGVLILHLIILILLIVSTAASAWSVGGDMSTDLWYNCRTSNGGYHCKPASNEDWIQAVQALMILSILFCFFSLIAFLFQLFKLVKGGRFFFTAIFQILASVFVMCAAIIYTVMSPDDRPWHRVRLRLRAGLGGFPSLSHQLASFISS